MCFVTSVLEIGASLAQKSHGYNAKGNRPIRSNPSERSVINAESAEDDGAANTAVPIHRALMLTALLASPTVPIKPNSSSS